AADKYDFQIALLVSPVITVIFALMLLFEQNSIMRAGRYIKDHIESAMYERTDSQDRVTGPPGWEHWLEKAPENRKAEKIFAWSVYVTFSIYYLLGAALSLQRVHNLWGDSALIVGVFVGLYAAGFLFAMFLVSRLLLTSTTPDRG